MSPTAPRSYLFALIDGGGTVPPELGAVRRLIDRGHSVEVLAEDSMIEEVTATGATFRPWVRAVNRPSRNAEHDPVQDWECGSQVELFTRTLDRLLAGPAPAYAADLMAAVEDRRPDCVVCSMFAVGAMVGAEAAGVPYVVLMPNIYMLPAPGLPPFGLGSQPPAGLLDRARTRMTTTRARRMWNQGLDRLNTLRTSLGLKAVDDFWDPIRCARKILVLTSPAFDFAAKLPTTVHYVGAVLEDPDWAIGQPWTLPPGADPIVLVAMSSTFQDQAGCIQRVIDGLASLPVRGIVTMGPALDPATFEPRSNVVVVASAPHSEVLAKAGAVVTHGGHGTVVRALAAGVPLVILPQGRDQADNGARVTARNAGLTLEHAADPATVAAAVRDVLTNPSYRQAAEHLGRSIRDDAASAALVTELEDAANPTATRC